MKRTTCLALGITMAALAVHTPASADTECTLRGEKAQKISWIRETGALMERQLAGAKSPAEKKLIQDVYQKRGTAVEVRAAVETDCREEKERMAR